MFKPIIHNLTDKDYAYAACQHYNRLIAKKPKGGATLQDKIEAQRQWAIACTNALDNAKRMLEA